MTIVTCVVAILGCILDITDRKDIPLNQNILTLQTFDKETNLKKYPNYKYTKSFIVESTSYFEENKNSYETELKSLDDEFKDIVANGRHRMIVVADKFPFRYFAQEYGLSYRAAFSGCSTDTDDRKSVV